MISKKSIITSDKDDINTNILYLPAPSTRAYQMVIDAFHSVYCLPLRELVLIGAPHNNKSYINRKDQWKIASITSTLLKTMMGRLVAFASRGVDLDPRIHGAEHVYTNIRPLSDTYNAVIDMWVSPFGNIFINLNEDNVDTEEKYRQILSEEEKESERNAIRKSSALLKEMELWCHDAHIRPKLEISSSKSNSDKNIVSSQNIIKSVSPNQHTFHLVLVAYSQLAMLHNSIQIAIEARQVLQRMHIRYQAYSTKLNSHDVHKQSYPTNESFLIVLSAFCTLALSNPSSTTASKVALNESISLLNEMESISQDYLYRKEGSDENDLVQPILDKNSYEMIISAFCQQDHSSCTAIRAWDLVLRLEDQHILIMKFQKSNNACQHNEILRPSLKLYNNILARCTIEASHNLFDKENFSEQLNLVEEIYNHLKEKKYAKCDSKTYGLMLKFYAQFLSYVSENKESHMSLEENEKRNKLKNEIKLKYMKINEECKGRHLVNEYTREMFLNCERHFQSE